MNTIKSAHYFIKSNEKKNKFKRDKYLIKSTSPIHAMNVSITNIFLIHLLEIQ